MDVQTSLCLLLLRVFGNFASSEGAKIGNNWRICSHCFIENDVVIGDRVTIKNGVYVFDSLFLRIKFLLERL